MPARKSIYGAGAGLVAAGLIAAGLLAVPGLGGTAYRQWPRMVSNAA